MGSEPTTEAGRALDDFLLAEDFCINPSRILAIEAEALEQERARIRAAVEAIDLDDPVWSEAIAAVLAAIEQREAK